MKQQYCDTDLITFNLQGLLWIAKGEYVGFKQETAYYLKLQYRTQNIQIEFPNAEIRDNAYEKARLLIVPKEETKDES